MCISVYTRLHKGKRKLIDHDHRIMELNNKGDREIFVTTESKPEKNPIQNPERKKGEQWNQRKQRKQHCMILTKHHNSFPGNFSCLDTEKT